MSEPATSTDRATTGDGCAAWTWRAEPRCKSCGYDLRGSPQPRCPECGAAYEPICPDCAGRGQQVLLSRGRRMIVALAIALLLLGAVLLAAPSPDWRTAVKLFAAAGILLLLAALAGAKSRRCARCHGTGIDFEDRIWTGRDA